MPYTNSWVDTFPPDSEAANLIGANLRQLRLDILERMNDQLFVDFTADPLVLKTSFGAKTGIQRVISFSEFVNYVTPNGIGIANGFITVQSAENAWAPLPVPVGCTVTKVEWLVDASAATTPVGSLQKQTFTTAVTNTVIDTVNLPTAFALTAGAVLTEVVDGGMVYWLKIGCAAGSLKLYGVRITFDRDGIDHAS